MGGGAAIILVVSLLGGQGFTELGRAGQQASLREAVRHRVFEINFQNGNWRRVPRDCRRTKGHEITLTYLHECIC